jgi:hypothetical protein
MNKLQERFVEEQADRLRLLVEVGGHGAFVAAFRDRAEIVLANVNRQSPKPSSLDAHAAPAFARPTSPWLSPSVDKMVHANRSQGVNGTRGRGAPGSRHRRRRASGPPERQGRRWPSTRGHHPSRMGCQRLLLGLWRAEAGPPPAYIGRWPALTAALRSDPIENRNIRAVESSRQGLRRAVRYRDLRMRDHRRKACDGVAFAGRDQPQFSDSMNTGCQVSGDPRLSPASGNVLPRRILLLLAQLHLAIFCELQALCGLVRRSLHVPSLCASIVHGNSL